MYRYTLEEQIRVLVEAGLVKDGLRAKAVEVLGEYWWDKVADVWHVDDVLDHALNGSDKKLTMESAVEVLNSITSSMDACVGINWDVLDVHIRNNGVELPDGCADTLEGREL